MHHPRPRNTLRVLLCSSACVLSGLPSAVADGGIINGPENSQQARSLALDETFLYVAGTNERGDLQIEKRFLETGGFDAAFGLGGAVTGAPSSEGVADLVLDGNTLYVAGYDAALNWRLEKRRASNGSLEGRFGRGGIVSGAAMTYQAHALALDETVLYVAGDGDHRPREAGQPVMAANWRLEKRRRDTGRLEHGFGVDGVLIATSVTYVPYALARHGPSLYVVGSACSFTAGLPVCDLRLEKRRLDTGELEPSFGTGGAITSVSPGHLPRVALDEGALYLVGSDAEGWRIEKRLLMSGALDQSFGNQGVIARQVPGGAAYAMVLDEKFLYVVGSDEQRNWRIEKRSRDYGVLDAAFGAAGVVTSEGASQHAYAVATDGESLYIAGSGDRNNWRLEKRLCSTGALDPNFGGSDDAS